MRLPVVLAVLLGSAACAVAAAAAQTLALNFIPPPGWSFEAGDGPRSGVIGVGTWTLGDGAALHALGVAAERYPETDVARLGARAVALLRADEAVRDLVAGPQTVCGDVPAFGYRYAIASGERRLAVRHVLAAAGDTTLHANYAHAAGVGDRDDALDALATLCDRRVYAMRPPAGWTPIPVAAAGGASAQGFRAPDGRGELLALASPLAPRRAPDPAAASVLPAGAAPLSDAEETCGTTPVRHVAYTTAATPPIATEIVVGYRHGMRYLSTYVRPAGTPADRGALAALHAFCAADAPLVAARERADRAAH